MTVRSGAKETGVSPIRILITGFGSFPGVSQNPTERLVFALARQKARFARLGVELHVCVLPVTYSGAAAKIAALTSSLRPHAVLHFGYAGRRSAICVETRALNRTSVLHPDAKGFTPRRAIIDRVPLLARSALPCRVMAASFRRAGLKSKASIDAGDYVCNHIFFLSLFAMNAGMAGFIHIPPLRRTARRNGATRNHRPDIERIAAGSIFAIIDIVRSVRAALREDRMNRA